MSEASELKLFIHRRFEAVITRLDALADRLTAIEAKLARPEQGPKWAQFAEPADQAERLRQEKP